jgi:DNA-binding NarL/FixJ family response regulator
LKSKWQKYVIAGASGYVLEEVHVDQLFAHIYAADEEKALVSPEIAAASMDH